MQNGLILQIGVPEVLQSPHELVLRVVSSLSHVNRLLVAEKLTKRCFAIFFCLAFQVSLTCADVQFQFTVEIINFCEIEHPRASYVTLYVVPPTENPAKNFCINASVSFCTVTIPNYKQACG